MIIVFLNADLLFMAQTTTKSLVVLVSQCRSYPVRPSLLIGRRGLLLGGISDKT